MRLWSKFFLLLVPLLAAPLLVLGYVAYGEVSEHARARVLEQMSVLLDQTQKRIQDRMDTAAANARLFASHSLVHKYALTDSERDRYSVLQRPLLNQLSEFQQAFPKYEAIRFVSPEGRVLASWTGSRDLSALGERSRVDRPLRRELQATVDTERAFVLPTHPNMADQINPEGEPIRLLAAKDLRLVNAIDTDPSAERRLRGYLVVNVDVSDLVEQIRTRELGQRGALMLVDDHGRLVLTREPAGSPLALNDDLPDSVESTLAEGAHQPTRVDWAGVSAFAAQRPLGPNVRLVGAVPASDITAAQQRLARKIIAITVVVALVTPFLVLAALGHIVVRPLRQLMRAADRMGEGDLTAPVPARSRDEVGVLGRRFEAMRDRLAVLNRKLTHQAHHDSLTGLPNRRLLEEHMRHALAEGQRHGDQLGVLFLDLDGFKQVNDSEGHGVGDALLHELAERLRQSLRAEDFVAMGTGEASADLISRIGGDEFIILLNRLQRGADAGMVATRILQSLERPLVLADGREYQLGASVGIALFPDDGTTAEELIHCADTAMYRAKRTGRNRALYYANSTEAIQGVHLDLGSRLERALREDNLTLHYQPQYGASDGRIVGFEGLARWHDAELGWIGPDQFIPVAESAGLIATLTRQLLHQACAQVREWQYLGIGPVPIAVNIAGEQIITAEIVDEVRRALEASGLEAAYLALEVTERTLIETNHAAVDVFRRLRELGVHLGLDDFGTGYSSLNYVRRFPFDHLKIDRSFVAAAGSSESDPALVTAMISMAHALGLQVIAEGVETEGQLGFLDANGCDCVQGFLFHPALEAEAATALLRDGRSGPIHAPQ